MKTAKFSPWVLTCLLFFTTLTLNAQSSGVEQFEWMLGKWKGDLGEGVFYESWNQKDENTLIGEGYYIIKGDTSLTELLRIQKIGKYWTYIPIINNNRPVLFTLILSDEENTWAFENKEHDFPQRVVYKQKKDGSLLAWIEGEMNGELMKEKYEMEKIK